MALFSFISCSIERGMLYFQPIPNKGFMEHWATDRSSCGGGTRKIINETKPMIIGSEEIESEDEVQVRQIGSRAKKILWWRELRRRCNGKNKGACTREVPDMKKLMHVYRDCKRYSFEEACTLNANFT